MYMHPFDYAIRGKKFSRRSSLERISKPAANRKKIRVEASKGNTELGDV